MRSDTNDGVIILCLYVDDLLITGSHDKSVSRFKSELMREFEMTDLGVMNYFLGIEFHKSKVGLLMHRRRYALDILKKCDMEHCNACITPCEARVQLSKSDEEDDVDPTLYRSLMDRYGICAIHDRIWLLVSVLRVDSWRGRRYHTWQQLRGSLDM